MVFLGVCLNNALKWHVTMCVKVILIHFPSLFYTYTHMHVHTHAFFVCSCACTCTHIHLFICVYTYIYFFSLEQLPNVDHGRLILEVFR